MALDVLLVMIWSGDYNVFLGNAEQAVTSGTGNIFLGRDAGCTTDGDAAAGFYAAKCRNSGNDIFIGSYAGMGCNGATGGCNIALGQHAGRCGTTGSNSVFLGRYAVNIPLLEIIISSEVRQECVTPLEFAILLQVFLLESAVIALMVSLLVGMLVVATEQLVPVILCLAMKQENVAQLVLIMLFL